MVKRSRFSHFAPFVALFWGGALLPSPVASIEVPLNQAVIQFLQNTVELSQHDQTPRLAKVQDTLSPGEALSTARAALAELRFDDGSLARIGGQARIRFVSKTRTLQLSNGTMLLLVPPERGQTRIQTPNASASVQGSALFVRYVPETNITLVGALTNNVEIANGDRSQAQTLAAGQLAVVTNNRLEPAYGFDLKTFYETSTLAKGLGFQPLAAARSGAADGAIEAVRAEATEAIQQQTRLCTGNGVPLETPQTARSTRRQPQPANTASCRPVSPTRIVPQTGQADTSTQPTPIEPPATALLTAPTIALPATIPPTLALPTNVPLVNPSTAIAPPIPAVPGIPSPPERPPLLNPNAPNPNPPGSNFLNPPNPNPPNPNPLNPDLADPTANNSVTPP